MTHTDTLKRITRDDTEHGVEYYRADEVDAMLAEQPAQQEPVAFPARKAVEREIERTANPTGMHLNDGKERVALPGGTLRHMLALIDRTSPQTAQPQPISEFPELQALVRKGLSDGSLTIQGATQPQQEPVAWMTHEVSTGTQVWLYENTAKRYQNPPTPLYTSPQPAQSKPLTENQKEQIWCDKFDGDTDLNSFCSIADAIEAAHNIKEKP